MVSSKDIYQQIEVILSKLDWEEYVDELNKLTDKLNELEQHTKHSKETTRNRDRGFNGRVRGL